MELQPGEPGHVVCATCGEAVSAEGVLLRAWHALQRKGVVSLAERIERGRVEKRRATTTGRAVKTNWSVT